MGRQTKYNKQTNDELISQINQENIDLMEEFLGYLKTVDRSDSTIHGYRNDLEIFFVWNLLHNKNKFFIDVTKREIAKYQNYLITINNSSNRIRRLKSTLSSMSEFIETMLDEDYPNFRNIINKIENPVKVPARKKTILTQQQIDTLLTALVERKQYQKACGLALAVASGARKSELARFKVEFFKDENIIFDCLYETSEEIKTKGKGSKGKPLKKYTFVKEFKPYFDLWMEERKRLGIDNEYLLINKNETTGEYEPVTVFTLNSWARTFSRILNVDFYWHSCRHLWTTNLKKKNLPDEVIVALQGWNTQTGSAMVAIYNDNDAIQSLGKFFGKDGIKEQKEVTLSDL